MLAWNARYITRVLDHRADTHPELAADDAALSRLAPVSHAHINPLGRYRFDNPDAPHPASFGRSTARTPTSTAASPPHRSASTATNT